jgi:glutamate--cysteine ligase
VGRVRAPLALRRLEEDVRSRLFRSAEPGAPPRVGLEAEVIPVSAADGRPCPIEPDPDRPGAPASGPLLRRLATEHGWCLDESAAGALAVLLPGGGALSFEPGGQLEYSTRPAPGPDALLDDVEAVLVPLARHAAAEGIRLLARGMDPVTPIEDTRLHLSGERYRRMTTHYDRRGPAGRCMMRQTAALHLNVDLGARPRERWWVANALAPLLTALFANSPRAAGVSTGHRSTRALQWRRLDPYRTGVQGRCADPEAAYLEFALGAPAFLLGPEDEPARPFRAWVGGGARFDDWARHLTTLFPEVRPRGYLELRCLDALPLRWYGAPVALAAGVLYDDASLDRALAALPPADEALLVRAGRDGLADPDVAAAAATALDLALEGLTRLDRGHGGYARTRRTLVAFRDEVTASGRDPGALPADDLLD